VRITLLNQFYPPDLAPTGRYLHDVARELLARGHEVTAIASASTYGGSAGARHAQDSWLDGVRVRRMPGTPFGRERLATKALDYGAYYARLGARLARQERPDVVVALTTPPFLGLLARWIAAARSARHVHWVMDVYPDVMRAHGLVRGRPYGALQTLARHAMGGARTVIGLGPAMADALRPYCDAGTRLEWVPLWSPPDLTPWPAAEPVPLRGRRGWDDGRPVVMYSGNFGLGHRFDEVLSAARLLGADGPRWVFAGGGRGRGEVERFAAAHPELPVELLPYAPAELLREHLSSADIHLVSLAARWEGLILPSKLQGSFAVGRPVAFVGSESGDLGRWVRESGGGWVVPEGRPEALRELLGQPPAELCAEARARGTAGHRFAEEWFDPGANIRRMADLITA
jgi:glycosyltransferase involved in cell wall biosynthesis